MKKGLKKYLVVNFYENISQYGNIKLATDKKDEAEAFAAVWNNNSESEKYYIFETTK